MGITYGVRKKIRVVGMGTETQFNTDKIVILTPIYSFKLQSHFLDSFYPREGSLPKEYLVALLGFKILYLVTYLRLCRMIYYCQLPIALL